MFYTVLLNGSPIGQYTKRENAERGIQIEIRLGGNPEEYIIVESEKGYDRCGTIA